MEWRTILAVVIAVPIVLFPVAFIWFINIGGIYAVIKEARARRVARQKDRIRGIVKIGTDVER